MSERKSQTEKAVMELRRMVFSGQFKPNERLPEIALSERLGISRTPLRQAMGRLVEEGLLERRDTGGCRVTGFSIEDIRDAIELRGTMEGLAARLAAEQGCVPELRVRCSKILTELDWAVNGPDGLNFDSYVDLNAAFHQLLSALSGSRIVQREVEKANKLPLASPSAFMRGQETIENFKLSLRIAQSQHRAIFEAIERRESARAEAMAREHARLACQNFEYLLNHNPEAAELVPGMALVTA